MLTCASSGRRSNGLVTFELRLVRPESSDQQQRPALKSYGHLIVGSIHDDALLAHESLVFEHFPSPLTLRLSTRSVPHNQVSHYLYLLGKLCCRANIDTSPFR